MNRKELYQKMLKYNPNWFKVLMPYVDGLPVTLPDSNNLELEYAKLNIESYSSCIVGEVYGFSAEYWNGKHDCQDCQEYARALDYYYNVDMQERHKQNSDILSTFRHTLELFYAHLDNAHKEISHNE